MSGLRAAAEEALQNRRAEQEAERAALAESIAIAGVKRAAKSPLGRWFPTIQWEFVANLTDGTTVVRERDGDPYPDLLLGVKVTKDGALDQGPDEWMVGVYRQAPGVFHPNNAFERIEKLDSAADLGEYLERTTPKPADEA